MRIGQLGWLGGLGTALALVACASAPPAPDAAIAAAVDAIYHAEDARVSDYAAQELRTAREKLDGARDAAQKARQDHSAKGLRQAQWLAEEAQADAQYAEAKAERERAQAAVRELKRSIETLSGSDGGGT